MIAICNYKANVKTLSNKKKKNLKPLVPSGLYSRLIYLYPASLQLLHSVLTRQDGL